MTKNYKVSIIINCFNSEKFIKKAIESALSQTYKNYEIIIYDNQSIDNTKKKIFELDHKKIHYYLSENYYNLGKARNKAIEKSTGDLIAILDSDDYWSPDKLSRQVEIFNKYNDIGICYTNALRVDEYDISLVSFNFEKKASLKNNFRTLISSSFIPCSSSMFKKSDFYDVGKFNEELKQVEEWDLWLKLSKTKKIFRVDEDLTFIRIHKDNFSRNLKQQFKEKMLLAKKIKNENPEYINDVIKMEIRSETQYHLSLILIETKLSLRLLSFLRVIALTLKSPILTVSFIYSLLNYKLFNSFREKYLR